MNDHINGGIHGVSIGGDTSCNSFSCDESQGGDMKIGGFLFGCSRFCFLCFRIVDHFSLISMLS